MLAVIIAATALFLFSPSPAYASGKGSTCLSSPTRRTPSERLDLSRAFELAKKRSEDLAIRDQDFIAAEARYRQALAGLFPSAELSASELYRDSASGNRDTNTGGGFSDNDFARGRRDRFVTAVTVTQPIFSGFREQILARAARHEMASIEHEKRRREETLFLEVGEVFYQSLLYSADLEELTKTEKTLRERQDELSRRVELGKSRESEALSAAAELEELLATKEQTAGLLESTRELLSFLVGIPAGSLSLEECIGGRNLGDLQSYLAKTAEREDLRSGRKIEESLRDQILAVERERWPKLELEGNFYPYDEPSVDRNWDVQVRAALPIFEGGRISARVREGEARLAAKKLENERIARLAETEVRRAYAAVQSATARTRQLERSVAANERSYKSQLEDYRVGVVTNLEVLSSIRREQESRRALLAARVARALEMTRLAVAAGGIES